MADMAELDGSIIRRMEFSDLPKVLEIENRASLSPWTKEVFTSILNAGFLGWVIEIDDEIAGFGLISLVIDECQILNIVIDNHWQGQGGGKKILRYMLHEAQQRGAHHCHLEVRRSNVVAQQLYYDMGFQQTGLRPDYYDCPNGHEDALILSLNL